ncbi:MAG: phage holin family protein [Bdellovibrionota bacterium]
MLEHVEQFTANVRPIFKALKADVEALTGDLSRMCRDELALGKELVNEGTTRLRVAGIAVGVALFFLLSALTLFVVAGVLLLRNVFPSLEWTSIFGLSGLVCSVIAAACVWVAYSQWKLFGEIRKRSSRLFSI